MDSRTTGELNRTIIIMQLDPTFHNLYWRLTRAVRRLVLMPSSMNHFENQKSFNDGYHIIHHAKPGLHWTQLPEEVRLVAFHHSAVSGCAVDPDLLIAVLPLSDSSCGLWTSTPPSTLLSSPAHTSLRLGCGRSRGASHPQSHARTHARYRRRLRC